MKKCWLWWVEARGNDEDDINALLHARGGWLIPILSAAGRHHHAPPICVSIYFAVPLCDVRCFSLALPHDTYSDGWWTHVSLPVGCVSIFTLWCGTNVYCLPTLHLSSHLRLCISAHCYATPLPTYLQASLSSSFPASVSPAWLPACLLVCLPACLPLCLSACLPASLLFCTTFHLPVYLLAFLFLRLSDCLPLLALDLRGLLGPHVVLHFIKSII